MADDSTTKVTAPYIPWDTFTGFIGHMKATVTPSRIDKSAMPANMPSLVRGQVQSALRFLRLIDVAGVPQPPLKKLVAAYETPDWSSEIIELLPAYDDIVDDLDVESATQHQLDEKFEAVGIRGQMLLKSVRFYLALLTACGASFSPHLNARRKPSGNGTPRRRCTIPPKSDTPSRSSEHQNPEEPEENDQETITYPMYFKNKKAGKIVIPKSLSKEDRNVVELTVAIVLAYGNQN